MMCAGIQNPKTCHIFDGNNNFALAAESHWPHTTGGVVNANDKLFLLAGGNLEVEKYNHHDRNWLHLTPRTTLRDVVHRTAPDATAYLEFSTVGMNNTVFAIGGLYAYGNDGPDKHFTNGLVYAMDIGTYDWRIFEQALLRARAWNRVVLFGASFALIGGENEHTDVERWTFNGRGFDQTLSEQSLPTTEHDWWEIYVIHDVEEYRDCLGPSPKKNILTNRKQVIGN